MDVTALLNAGIQQWKKERELKTEKELHGIEGNSQG